MIRKFQLFAVSMTLLAVTGCASSGLVGLAPTEQKDAQRVAQYLDGIRDLEGRFVQTGPDNGESGGTFAYAPGHLKLDYSMPHVMHLTAGNGKIVIDDSETGSTTHLSLSHNPLGLLLRTPVNFDDGVKVTSVQRGDHSLQLSAARSDNPSQGLLTLQFLDLNGQLSMIGLEGVDARQHHITLHFYDVHSGASAP